MTITYDSEHAVVSEERTLSAFTVGEHTSMPLTVPYLLYEDFSNCQNFEGPEEAGDASGNELSSANLPGWYAGARSEGVAGLCVALHSYSNVGGPYQSRVDSRSLSELKAGSTVTVRIIFNADWKKNKSESMQLVVGRTSGHNLNSSINDQTAIPMANQSSASASYIPTERQVEVPNFTSDQSIAWKTDGSNASLWNYFNYEDIFIDNVKVSIIQ